MDRFGDLQMFVKVVETGSISGAADKLEVAKSAVSRRLSDLEARLGVELMHRTTRRLNLTDSGRVFYERAQRILADLEEAEQSVSHAHCDLSGRLKVALPLSFGLLHLAPLITEFMGQHPQVEFDLDFNDRQIDLMQEGFDLAIRIARLPDSSLIARRLAPIRMCLCASPAYLAQRGTPERPEDLAAHAFLAYSNLANPGLLPFVDPDGKPGEVQIPVATRANNGDFLCRAAVAGNGLVLSPTFYLRGALDRGELMPLLPGYTWPSVDVHAVYPPTRHLSRRVRTLVDFLAQRLAGEPYWDVPGGEISG